MNSQINKDIISYLCRKHNISEPQAIEIIYSQFRVARETMECREDINVGIIYWGKFMIKPSKKKHVKDE